MMVFEGERNGILDMVVYKYLFMFQVECNGGEKDYNSF
jgi:hypothetical protein